jgi:ABC transport system ATP-binding/permease protein
VSTARNLVNVSQVSKGFAARQILTDVTLGISEGDRIGVVGQNGQGKSTLVELIAGTEQPDSGKVTRLGTLTLGHLDQGDRLDPGDTIRAALVGARAEHEWAADRAFREVLDGLLGGASFSRFPQGIETVVGSLSGGERRRIALAQVLLDHPDLLLLDEPTNHLDVEVIAWLARHLANRAGAQMIVTHDRWFLDAVCTHTWEVADGSVHQYEGGYAAYVLAKAERDRIASVREERRQQLMRKELAWLRRGPPARTAKPKFRIEAANALIADEPPVRDRTELLRFAGSRLGKTVIDAERISYSYDSGAARSRRVIDDVTWLLGPGERVALVGANGSGKTTLLKLLAAELQPDSGTVVRGETVRLAHLGQHASELPEHLSVLEAVEEVKRRAVLSTGEEITAGRLAERFGFRGEKARTRVSGLSGGERRRLTLMRLLMGEPNVLLLDEPTNDLDIDTLTALEDLLDGWPGTLLIVSHDRYFTERVCDNVFYVNPGGHVQHLPGGIDQYLDLIAPPTANAAPSAAEPSGAQAPAATNGRLSGGEIRTAKKEVQRLERELQRASDREADLHRQMVEAASDHTRLAELTAQLSEATSAREELELAWLEVAEALEG